MKQDKKVTMSTVDPAAAARAEAREAAAAAKAEKKAQAFAAKKEKLIAQATAKGNKMIAAAEAKAEKVIAKARMAVEKEKNAGRRIDLGYELEDTIKEMEAYVAETKKNAERLIIDAQARQGGMTIQQRNSIKGYAFISPWILGFCVFIAYPLIYSIILSLNQIKLIPTGTEYTFKGLFFYDYALNQTTNFRTSLTSQVTMICYMTPIILVFSLIIALLLNGKFRMRAFFRGSFFMPVIIMSGPAISQLLTKYTVDFSEDSPLIFEFLSNLPEVLATPAEYVLNNLVLILWFCGVQILIFLAGVQKIGTDLYEAASIDGAGAWEKFWKITLPHLSPLILISGVYTIIDIANYSKGSMNTLINNQIFNAKYLYSYSAAMAWMYFIVVALLLLAMLLIFKFFGRKAKT